MQRRFTAILRALPPLLAFSACLALVATTTTECSRARAANSGRMKTTDVPVVPPVFPLQVSSDGRYLVDRAGKPFLIQGDAGWSILVQLKDDEVETYLEDRRRRGFNAILVNLLEHKFADHAPRNAYGDAPFTKPGDFSTPNEGYFAHADKVLHLARQKGLAVMLAAAYLGQKGGDEGWYQEELRNGPEAMRAYGAYVGRRYRAFDNVIWVLGGDYMPPPQGMALVDALGQGIRSTDPEHLVTAHFDAETSAQDASLTTPLNLNTTYTYRPVYEKSLANTLRPAALPHFLIETTYEFEHESTPRLLRAQAYYALLTGAVGQVFGNGTIWGFWRSWPAMLGSDGCLGMMNSEGPRRAARLDDARARRPKRSAHGGHGGQRLQ